MCRRAFYLQCYGLSAVLPCAKGQAKRHDFWHWARGPAVVYSRGEMLPASFIVFRVSAVFVASMVTLAEAVKFFQLGREKLAVSTKGQLDPSQIELVYWAVLAATVVIFAVFLAAFWRTTRPLAEDRPERVRFVLLALQVVLGLLVSTDLLYIVAAEMGYLLPTRAGLAWLGASMAVAALFVHSWAFGEDKEWKRDIGDVPPPAVFVIGLAYICGWSFFAYSMGYLAAAENRSRRALNYANAELTGAQHLLAESERMTERLRISRELHDSLGHHLVGLTVSLQVASRCDGDEARAHVDDAHLVAKLLLRDVRDAVSTLRRGGEVDLRGAIERLAAGVESPAIHLAYDHELTVSDSSLAHALYRGVQEIITNSIKHARARNLWITLRRDDRGVRLEARDDGQGAAAYTMGNGLRGMRERVEQAGGRISVMTQPGAGFTVDIWTPLEAL